MEKYVNIKLEINIGVIVHMEKEIELLKRAKIYIDSLANGVNPFDGTTLPENDIVNNIKISRCLFYVSSILEQNLANIQGSKKT